MNFLGNDNNDSGDDTCDDGDDNWFAADSRGEGKRGSSVSPGHFKNVGKAQGMECTDTDGVARFDDDDDIDDDCADDDNDDVTSDINGINHKSGADIMEADERQVTTVFTVQSSFHHRHSTNQVHKALPSSANVQSHLTSSFADDGNASWYSVCQVPMMEWRMACDNCRHLTVVGLHENGPRSFYKS